MNRSLVLLNLLRGRAWLRRWTRSFRTLKGLLLAVVGSLVFVPMIISALLAPRVQTAAQLGAIREYGPLALFTYCVLNVLLSSGDRAVYYSPAEVIFLFSGPFRPRQILLYKITSGFAPAILTALVMTFAFGHHAASYHAAFLGLFLSLHLLYLFSLSVGLAISTFGALAFNWSRRLLLLALGLIALGALWPLGERAMSMTPMELLQQVLHSPTVTAIVAPFRPFVWTFSADRGVARPHRVVRALPHHRSDAPGLRAGLEWAVPGSLGRRERADLLTAPARSSRRVARGLESRPRNPPDAALVGWYRSELLATVDDRVPVPRAAGGFVSPLPLPRRHGPADGAEHAGG